MGRCLISLETAVFREVYSLMVSAYSMRDIEENWELLQEKGQQICETYADTPAEKLAVDLAAAVVSHMETVKELERQPKGGGDAYAPDHRMGQGMAG